MVKEKLGYVRVSTDRQDSQNQKLELLKVVSPENLYDDSGISGTVPAKKRKEFKKIFERIQNGEVEELYVFELSRLGRTSTETIQLILEIEQLGVHIISLSPNETWTKLVDSPGIRNIFVSMFAWFADLERASISERTKSGLKRAKSEGKHLGRPFSDLDRKQYEKVKTANPQLKTAQIARLMQVPPTTLYRYVAQWEEEDRISANKKLM